MVISCYDDSLLRGATRTLLEGEEVEAEEEEEDMSVDVTSAERALAADVVEDGRTGGDLDVEFADGFDYGAAHDADVDMVLLDEEDDEDEDEDDFLTVPSLNLRHFLICERIVSCLASCTSSTLTEVWLGPSFASASVAASAIRALPRTVTALDLDLRSLPASDVAHSVWPALVRRRSHLQSVTIRIPHPSLVGALSKTIQAMSYDSSSHAAHSNFDSDVDVDSNDIADGPEFGWKSLDLCGNRIDNDALNHLVDALAHMRHSLTSINLSCNDISDGDAVSRLLKTAAPALRRLELSFNLISDDALRRICLQLGNPHSQLRTLHLFGCQRLSCEGLRYLADCLEHRNSTLFRAHVGACGYADDDNNPVAAPTHAHQVVAQIQRWLLLNRSGRYLLRDRTIPLALLPHLLARIRTEPDAVYYHLQQAPRAFV